jgi:hypothetical protein
MEQQPTLAQAIALGAVDTQTRAGRQTIVSERRNASGGLERAMTLQVHSPFGHAFALTVELETHALSCEAEAALTKGAPVAISGSLEWPRPISRRSAAQSGRDDVVLRARHVALATEGGAGCRMRFEGQVLTAARVVRHPYRSDILLAATVIECGAQAQSGASMFLADPLRIPVVIALHHPDAPALLRPGNRVNVDSMLERVTVTRRADEVEPAVQALDEAWAAQRAAIDMHGMADAERRYAAERRRLARIHLARMAIGSATLLEGTPASPRESRALREQHIRNRRDARQAASA